MKGLAYVCVKNGLSAMETSEILKLDIEIQVKAAMCGQEDTIAEFKSNPYEWYKRLRFFQLMDTKRRIEKEARELFRSGRRSLSDKAKEEMSDFEREYY